MILTTVYVRFFKAFNYQFLRTESDEPTKPWDVTPEGLVYPFVSVPIESSITTVVGANESGKTQLLDAIAAALSGEGIEQRDFCRYSQFFAVDLRKPEFGCEISDIDEDTYQQLRSVVPELPAPHKPPKDNASAGDATAEAAPLPAEEASDHEEHVDDNASAGETTPKADAVTAEATPDHEEPEPAASVGTSAEPNAPATYRLLVFRRGSGQTELYWPDSSEDSGYAGREVDHDDVEAILPVPHRLEAETPIPDDVPLDYLIDPSKLDVIASRTARQRFKAGFTSLDPGMFGSWQDTKANFASVQSALGIGLAGVEPMTTAEREEYVLAGKLLHDIAKVPRATFAELKNVRNNPGYVRAILSSINENIATHLNLSKYWSQDQAFELLVSLDDESLVFTIRDRTGREYKFDERSRGLRWFLSYFVQYLSFEPPSDSPVVVLMDEPDAYLSSQGQQDLLQVLKEFAFPVLPGRSAAQVVYVTHSPFMIDKNHNERIRVIERGEFDEGARVVRKVAGNHYEPLRSAFGAFVGETAFIGNCNLIVEGPTDQIVLAAMSRVLRRAGESDLTTLDLNHLTLVPASSAKHATFLTFLARGRDQDKPPCVVLFDSDKAGNNARAELQGAFPGVPSNLIDDAFVLQVGEVDSLVTDGSRGVIDLEDLVPLPIAVAACVRYGKFYLGGERGARLQTISIDAVSCLEGEGVFDAICRVASDVVGGDFKLAKFEFARSVADVVEMQSLSPDAELAGAMATISKNFALLNGALVSRINRATETEATGRNRALIRRMVRKFKRDHPSPAQRQDAVKLVDSLEAFLKDAPASNELMTAIRDLRHSHKLDEDVLERIGDYSAFLRDLDDLPQIERRIAETAQ